MQLFTRYGDAPRAAIQSDAKGRPFCTYPRACGRCGGAGRSDKWAHTGYTCYDCGGARFNGTETAKLYTAEQLAALNARKAKADAKRATIAQAKADKAAAESAARAGAFRANNAALIARAAAHMDNEFISDVMTRSLASNMISDGQAAAVLAAVDRIETRAKIAAASRHIGKAGERIEAAVTVERVSNFERPRFNAPWLTEIFTIVTMRDADGNAIVCKSTSFYAEKGSQFVLRGTIKEHGSYNDERQTIVIRCKQIAAAEAA